MQVQNFVFFGIVGSGKGTQVKLLIDFLKKGDGKECVYACPGVEYRKIVDSGNYTGELIKESVAAGHLQPGFLTDAIVANIFMTSLTPDKHIITDGYPREVTQSQSLESMFKFYKRQDVKIIYIELSEAEAMKRNLLRGRQDDTEQGLKKRFEEYRNKVVPAMDYFKGKPGFTIYTINGEQSVEDVHKDIIQALGF